MWGPNYEQDKIEGDDLKLIQTTITNTLAILTNAPEHRDVFLLDLEEGRDALRQLWGERKMSAFMDAVISLIKADGDAEGLGDHLRGDYQAAWQVLIAQLAMLRGH